MYAKNEKIYLAYVSKHNSEHSSKQNKSSINNFKWRRMTYIAVKKLSVSLTGVFSKHDGDFYCLNCFHSFSTKNRLKSRKMYVKIKIFVML